MLVNITEALYTVGAIAANNTLSAFFDKSSGIISLEPVSGVLLSSTDFLWTPVWLKSQFADVLPNYANRDIYITQGSLHQKVDFFGTQGELYWDTLADSICQRVVEKRLDNGPDTAIYRLQGISFGNITTFGDTSTEPSHYTDNFYVADLGKSYPLPVGNISVDNWDRGYANACSLKYAAPNRARPNITLQFTGNNYIGQHVAQRANVADGTCVQLYTPLCSTGDLEGPCWSEIVVHQDGSTNLQMVLYETGGCNGAAVSARYFLTDTDAIGINSQEYGASSIGSIAIFQRQ